MWVFLFITKTWARRSYGMEAIAVFWTSVGGVFWRLTSPLFCFYRHGVYYLEFLVIIPLKAEKTNYALHLGNVEELHAFFLIFLEFLKLKILVISAKRQFVSSHPTTKLILYWGLLSSRCLYWVRKLAVQTANPNKRGRVLLMGIRFRTGRGTNSVVGNSRKGSRFWWL